MRPFDSTDSPLSGCHEGVHGAATGDGMKTHYALALGLYWLGCSPPSPAQLSKPFLTPPVMGYVYDESSAGVHAVMGVAGAASLSPAFLWSGPEIHAAPGLAFGLVARDGLSLVRWEVGTPIVQRLSKTVEGHGKVAFSPSARTAAVHWTEAARVEVWSGLPDHPVLKWSADIDTNSSESLLAAVPDDGSMAVLIEGSAAFLLSPSGSLRPAGAGVSVRSAAFRPSSRDLLLVAGQEAGAVLLRDAETPAGRFRPADFAAFSSDGRSIVLASREASEIAMIDLATGAEAKVDCDCRPEGLFRLSGNAVFRLSAGVKGGFPVFDGDAPAPRAALVAAQEVQP